MKYVVAVSGGLDSVVLLDMLAKLASHQSGLELIVAHADHGIRDESERDAEHVEGLAGHYGLSYEMTRLELGKGASEETARDARYAWLEEVRAKHRADGVITAHHQDDVLETVALNFGRGTGWRGLASLRTADEKYRPLLGASKASLAQYAIDNKLSWREDSTNDDLRYTRNYIRHGVVPKLNGETRRKLLALAEQQRKLRDKIEAEVVKVLADVKDDIGLSRHKLIMMPDSVALEVLRAATDGTHEPLHLRRLLHFAKTGRQGSLLNLSKGKNALLTKQRLIV